MRTSAYGAVLVGSLVVLGAVTQFDASQSAPGALRPAQGGADLKAIASGLHGVSLHDQCTGEYAPPAEIDNAEPGRPDRLQIIKGLSDTPIAGQMLRLEVLRVTLRSEEAKR